MLNAKVGTGGGSTLVTVKYETAVEKYFGFHLYLCFPSE